MKKITSLLSSLLGLLAVGFTNAQESEYYGRVGINTETPQATLDIVGRPTDANAVDGILIPRITLYSLTKKQNYGIKERGTLIFIIGTYQKNTDDFLSNVIKDKKFKSIEDDGFHYWDGEKWLPFGKFTYVDETLTIGGGRSINEFNIDANGENKGLLFSHMTPSFSKIEQRQSSIGLMYMNTETNTIHIWNGREWLTANEIMVKEELSN